MGRHRLAWATGIAIAAGLLAAPAMAETLKIAIGQRGNWENSPAQLGQEAGIFKKHGLDLEILYTQGGGETLQAVLSGSVDIGIGVGTPGVMTAFSKGAPVRMIANSTTGANDLYWYVPADSPIKAMADAAGHSVAFSTNGSSTNVTVLALLKNLGIDATPVATGNPASTFTQVMSGQVDVGWASPPFGVQALQDGKIRVVARGSDVPSFRNQTVRVMITSAPVLDEKKDAIGRFLQAYGETLDWMYSDPAAVAAYAKWVEVPPDIAERVRNDFYPKENLRLNRLAGIDAAMTDAVALKFLAAPLSQDQLATLVQYPTKPTE
jgi:NitT/TauT family transport system substrate-binding protein